MCQGRERARPRIESIQSILGSNPYCSGAIEVHEVYAVVAQGARNLAEPGLFGIHSTGVSTASVRAFPGEP